MYFEKLRQKTVQGPRIGAFKPIEFDRLRWHRSRLAQVIQYAPPYSPDMIQVTLPRRHLRTTFPSSALMYRVTTQVRGPRDKDDTEMIGVYQLNESAKALMRTLKIPLFNCHSPRHVPVSQRRAETAFLRGRPGIGQSRIRRRQSLPHRVCV